MSIFNVNFATFGIEMLPPSLRNSRLVKLVYTLLSQVQYQRDLIFDSYGSGSPALPFASGTAYPLGARVIYKHAVFESLTAGNSDVPPTMNWFMVQTSAIGVTEQALYTGQKIVLEYAINRWFGTTFLQPPGQSQIYLAPTVPTPPVFRVGSTESASSSVSSATSSEFVENIYTTQAIANMTINIPAAIYAALDPLATNQAAIVNSFIKQYLPAGITYTIATY